MLAPLRLDGGVQLRQRLHGVLPNERETQARERKHHRGLLGKKDRWALVRHRFFKIERALDLYSESRKRQHAANQGIYRRKRSHLSRIHDRAADDQRILEQGHHEKTVHFPSDAKDPHQSYL